MQRFNSSTEPWLRFSQTTPKAWLIPPGNEAQSLASTSLLKESWSYFKLCSTSKQASAGHLYWPLHSQIIPHKGLYVPSSPRN